MFCLLSLQTKHAGTQGEIGRARESERKRGREGERGGERGREGERGGEREMGREGEGREHEAYGCKTD
jgi:hypothetical protein